LQARHRIPTPLPLPLRIALTAAVYVLVAQLGLLYATAPGRVSAVWPLAGLMLAILVRGGLRLWPAVAIGDFIVALTIDLPLGAAAGVALATTVEALLGAFLLLRAVEGAPSSDRLRDVAALTALAGIVSPAVSALLATAGLLLGGEIGPADIETTWLTWWIGDMIGVLLVTPLLLPCDRYFRSVLSWRRLAEAAALYLTLAVFTVLLFQGNLHYSYLVAPFIIWAALRIGTRGAAIATLLFAVIAIESTTQGAGPFVQETLGTSLIYLQTFIGIVAVVSLVLSAALSERRRVERSLALTASVSTLLSHQLDEATIVRLARLLVPALGDVCLIDVRQAGIRAREVAATSTELEERARGVLSTLMLPEPRAPEARGALLIGAGEPAAYPELARLGAALGARATIAAPLAVQDHFAGWLVLCAVRPARSYRADDLRLAEDLAQRAAQAVENAHLTAQLVHAQKLESIGQLAGGIAHDFNNMLTVITSSAELALGEVAEESEARQEIDAILDAAGRASQLTRQLLAFARKQQLRPQLIDLVRLVGETAPLLSRLLPEQSKLIIEMAPGLGRARADRAQLEQVLVNLVINARDAMPSGGKLTIRGANVTLDELAARAVPGLPPGEYVLLEVRDTGVGMSGEVLARIFEPFFTTKAEGRGTGLGLAVCYGIVRQSGGQITATTAPGRGSTFSVYLPRVEVAAEVSNL
jgi:signal transduction histidine kinase